MLLYIALFLLLVIAFFDLYWILRLILTRILSKVLPALNIHDESVVYGLCWTTDLDYFAHMNNSKYFREMDFGRFDFYFRSGCSAYIEARGGTYVVQHGASIRYRRSINCFVPFKLVTKLVYYDERSLYFEQRFVSLHDGFVRAVALCKNTVVGGSARQMVDSLGAGGMDMPKEVSLWLESQQESSDKLRAESGGSSKESSVPQEGEAGGRSSALRGEEGGSKIKGL